MVTLHKIELLKNNDGLTLKKGKSITYKSGWQVATEGVECKTAEEAMAAITSYKGDCGIWLADGVFYVDKSRRVNTKKEAMRIGRECKQISVLKWSDMSLAYC